MFFFTFFKRLVNIIFKSQSLFFTYRLDALLTTCVEFLLLSSNLFLPLLDLRRQTDDN